MVLYLEEGFSFYLKQGKMKNVDDLINMTVNYGSPRIRPLLMAVGMNIIGLIPILLSYDVGADVAKRISAPLWGGLITLTISTLLIIPAIYVIWRSRQFKTH
ncbi:MAG: Cation efflux system protein CusA [candidate division TM6 bacterium GW2011_GWE2_36_25]|nr:MAG: Cation efflux system protein CusA [candidate division TM6 bacterium GW2011_GWF2_36_131]KKQ03627.1 MAG: Cation efflux system protein CusA [candidate division TM6 bacterium GW2011_GWE2_36_25]